jgi:hypothetical protein
MLCTICFLFQGLVNPAVPIKGKMVKIILDHFGIFWRHWGFPNQLPVAKTCHNQSPWIWSHILLGSSPVHRWRPSRGLWSGWQHAGHGWPTRRVRLETIPRIWSHPPPWMKPPGEGMSSESNALWLMEVIQLRESWDVLGAVGAFRICISASTLTIVTLVLMLISGYANQISADSRSSNLQRFRHLKHLTKRKFTC